MSQPSFSFPRKWILKKPDSFRSLYRDGLRLRGESITIFYRPAAGDVFRVGFSTRKKLAGAVGRNRARRLMREVFRLHQHEIKRGVECLFVWYGPIRGVRYRTAEKEIMKLLRQGDLLK